MKKRSLVAALAMLLVSALVLTSATYAWFAKGSAATTGNVVGTAAGADGLVKVCKTASTTYSDWKSSLSRDELVGQNHSTGLIPIDVIPSATPSWFTCTYDGDNYSASATTQSDDFNDYGYAYDFYIKAFDVNPLGKISVKATFSAGSGTHFVYAIVAVGSTYYLFGTADSTVVYTPFSGGGVATEAGTRNNIVDDNDSAKTITLGTPLTESNLTGGTELTFDIQGTAQSGVTSPQQVSVWIWAEGQDPQCTGSNSCTDAGLQFSNITYSPPTT